MAKDCLYCGLQFSDTTTFCPNCGRPTESGFSIRPMQESEVDRLRREVQEKDELIRQLVLTRTMRGGPSRATARSIDRRSSCGSNERRGGLPPHPRYVLGTRRGASDVRGDGTGSVGGEKQALRVPISQDA
jgi:hypothetical protein